MERHNDLPDFDFVREEGSPVRQLRAQNVATETIDLSSLFTRDVYTSGSFDLSGVGSTSFGRLLDALPLPALLIDRWHCVGFANQSCTKVSSDFTKILGTPFLDLLSRPRESSKVQELSNKMQALLEKAFAVRRPQTAEAILEMDQTKIWARLHIRSVRIGLERHLLVLIEDVTHEKRQLALNRRQDAEFRRIQRDLEAHLQVLRSELAATGQHLAKEIDDHAQIQKALRNEQRKMEIVCEHTALATAVLTPMGAFKEMNQRFHELFGFDVEEIPNFRDWITSTVGDSALTHGTASELLEMLSGAEKQEISGPTCTVMCRDGSRKQICFAVAGLDDGDYFVSCHEWAKTEPRKEQSGS